MFDELRDLKQRQMLLTNETRKALEDGVVLNRDDATPLNSFKFKDLSISFKPHQDLTGNQLSNFEPQEYTVYDVELEKEKINNNNTGYSSFYLPTESSFSLQDKGSPLANSTQIGEEIDFSRDRINSTASDISVTKNKSYELLKDKKTNDSTFSSRRLSVASTASSHVGSASPKSPKAVDRSSEKDLSSSKYSTLRLEKSVAKFSFIYNLYSDENLKQKVIEYFKLSRMEVDDVSDNYDSLINFIFLVKK
jgi:hypothetical protein